MKEKDKIPSLIEVITSLREAQEVYARADAVKREADRAHTAALNTLNEAQKAFDAAVAAEKKSPPWNSEWARENQPKADAE